nr:MAG TPA: hypothetical protein [Caudoviricetes sp.]
MGYYRRLTLLDRTCQSQESAQDWPENVLDCSWSRYVS